MPAGAGRQLDGGKRWETMVAGAGRDSWTGGKRWETIVAGAGRDSWTGSHDAQERGDSWEESWPFTH